MRRLRGGLDNQQIYVALPVCFTARPASEQNDLLRVNLLYQPPDNLRQNAFIHRYGGHVSIIVP